ncbi:MAG: hypothetical protein ACXWSD_10575 [Bdellovibrionota bacterium]
MKFILFIVTALTMALPGSAFAYFPREQWHARGWERPYHPMYSSWHNGYWNHGYHGGRFGWWWVNAGMWTFFAAPTIGTPPEPRTVIVEVPAPTPAPVVVTPPPAAPVAVIPHLPTGADSTLFYCASANAYFPYAANCAEGWELQQGRHAR